MHKVAMVLRRTAVCLKRSIVDRRYFYIKVLTPIQTQRDFSLVRVQCMYLSNSTLFDGRVISSIYYIRYNYMFRRLTMAIFRLYMKYLVSSYTRLNMGCIQWGGRS